MRGEVGNTFDAEKPVEAEEERVDAVCEGVEGVEVGEEEGGEGVGVRDAVVEEGVGGEGEEGEEEHGDLGGGDGGSCSELASAAVSVGSGRRTDYHGAHAVDSEGFVEDGHVQSKLGARLEIKEVEEFLSTSVLFDADGREGNVRLGAEWRARSAG